MDQNKISINLYPSNDGYIGKIYVPTSVVSNNYSSVDNCDTYVILDRSGSMGNSVPRLVNKILPNVFTKLNYKADNKIKLITFDEYVDIYNNTISDISKLNIQARGCTYMCTAIDKLNNMIHLEGKKNIRILTISDGELHDQDRTVNMSSSIATYLKNNYRINSQAVRFFTSSQQPDTRGLSSVLQFNSVQEAKLIDINYTMANVSIINSIVSLFENDSLIRNYTMKFNEPIVMKTPWDEPTNSIQLSEGDNTVWFKSIPKDFAGSDHIKIQICDNLSIDNFEIILKEKINYYINQLKLLKVVNTDQANKEISNIMRYFSELDKSILQADSDLIKLLGDNSLRGRIEYFKNVIKKRNKSIIIKMAEIANDQKIALLNSAQQAEYLRTVDVSKNTKGLARRALENDINFDEVARKEVRNMKIHLHELKDIDDRDHTTSFYSQDTTLGGIRAICEFVDNNLIDDMNVNDILKIINIVGVACDGVIGDYPDAMTWRVDEMFTGCYVSISDILTAYIASGGKALKAVGSEKEIKNVIPIFDDQRVHKFLRKYAPTLLEYTCSIGMRRIIADVPMTFAYTICAGIWKLIEDINSDKSEINIRTLIKLVEGYKVATGSYFDYIMEYINEQDSKLSYYLGNNGVTNMIRPMLKLIEQGNTTNMNSIMRALYNYEIYQATKRLYKGLLNSEDKITETLYKLLGIDFDKYKTPIKPLFEKENPVFYNDIHICEDELKRLINTFWYANYLTILPDIFTAIQQPDPIKAIRNIPRITPDSMCKAFNITYDLRTFQLFNIVQCLIYNNKSKRVDSENNKMKIIDLSDYKVADAFVRDYVQRQYIAKYQSELSHKSRLEKEELIKIMVDKITKTDDINEMIEFMINGITKENINVKIVNTSSIGYIDLKTRLLDTTIMIPNRCDKLKILLMGRDNKDNIVWNNGNVLFTDLKEFANVFTKEGKDDEWKIIKEEYMKRKLHIYRGDTSKENRHGHSNDKPSYWAYGYQTIEDMAKNISVEDWQKYKTIHYNCCGVSQLNF